VRLTKVELRDFRNVARATLELGDAITVVHGPNGAGKTNLLEGIHFALTGGACRTRTDREVIRFGQPAARAVATVADRDGISRFTSSIARAGDRRYDVEGPAGARSERPLVGVFLPERLELIKGGPGERRNHLDRFVAALWPARAELRKRFGRALAQRNALLGRIKAGEAGLDQLAAWDGEFARQALPVIEARREAVEMLSPPFAELAREIGLAGAAALSYRPRIDARTVAEVEAELAERHAEDLARGYSAHGPHGDELTFELDGRALRRYGSQGQQRMSLLALLLAERRLLLESRGTAPLMLLDDVMSELDPAHRGRLIELLGKAGGQSLITATEAGQVPDSAQVKAVDVLEVTASGAESEAA
jgi:DNA replication and repair protein RecF